MLRLLTSPLFIILYGLFFTSLAQASGPKCSDVFKSQYSYLDQGATGVAFTKNGLVHKVPYNADASNYFLNSGWAIARHEAMLLRTFNKLINEANVTEFRPLENIEAKKIEDPALLALVTQRMPKDQWWESITIDGVLVSEYVVGRTLFDVLMDPNLPPEVATHYAQSFYNAMMKIETHLNSGSSSIQATSHSSPSINRVYESDPNLIIPSTKIEFPWAIWVELKSPEAALQNDYSFFLSLGTNIIVDAQGKFVLVDPN